MGYWNKTIGFRTMIICVLIVMGLGIVISTSVHASAQEYSIPSWVKTTAKWWGEGQIGDNDFIKAIQYLIDNKILVVSNSGSTSQNSLPVTQNTQNIQSMQQVAQNNTTTSQTQNSGKSINDIMPTRDDIGTEWVIQAATSNNGNGTDYLSNVSQTFTKTDSGMNTIMGVTVYGFNSASGAQQHYNSKIAALKAQGGYQEVSGLDPNCYGVMYDYTLEEKVTVYCFKDNFYMVSSGVSGSLNLQDDVVMFAKAVLGKA